MALCRRFRIRATTAGAAHSKAACAFRSKSPAQFALSFRAGLPFGARFTGSDWLDGGLTVADAVVLAKALKDAGLDYVDVSSGGVSTQGQASVPAGARLQRCRSPIRFGAKPGIATRVVGMIASPKQAEAIVAERPR